MNETKSYNPIKPTLQTRLNDLIRSSPLCIQRHFGCDCIERTLQRQDDGLLEVLEIVRRHIAGQAGDYELIYALDTSEKILDKQNQPMRMYRTTEAVISLCCHHPDTVFVQQIAAWSIATYDAGTANSDMKRLFSWHEIWDAFHIDEIKWQAEHLRSLLAFNKKMQSSLLFAMQQRVKNINSTLDGYSKSLEEKLFE